MNYFMTKYFTEQEINDLLNINETIRASRVMKRIFENKVDKAGNPYEEHCIRVSVKVPEEYKAAALLHDILEDCKDCTIQYLRDFNFSEQTIEIIEILTKIKEVDYKDYIDGIIHSKNNGALIVKYFDICDNTDPKRLNLLSNETQNYLLDKYSIEKEKLHEEIYQRGLDYLIE